MQDHVTNPLNAVSRRDFLKSSTLIAASAAAAVTFPAVLRAQSNQPINAVVIGIGGRGGGAGANFLEAAKVAGVEGKIVGVADIFPGQAKRGTESFGVPEDKCFSGFDAYQKVLAIPGVNYAILATPPGFRAVHFKAAVEAGKHVFVEKPHGIDPAGIKVLQKASEMAKQKGLCLVSGLHSRYHAGYQELMKRVHDGAIGDIVSIEENFLRPPYGVTDRKAGLTELEWQASTQYHFVWLSGDDVVQSLVHNLDRASWALKEVVPLKCHGLGGRSTMTEPNYGNVFDHHSVVYECPNGVRIYAFCRTTTGCYDEYSSLIFGTKGKADVMRCRIWGETKWHGNESHDAHYQEQIEYMKAVRAGTPINNGDYMTRSTLMGIMGQISCYTGKEVTWEQINQSDFGYAPKPEDCHDGMEPPTKPGSDGSYPVYVPGRTNLI